MATGADVAVRRRVDLGRRSPRGGGGATVEAVSVSAYTIPTDYPESDGTLEWDRTTLVLVEATGAGRVGLGYTYADTATAELIRSRLADVVISHDAMAPQRMLDAGSVDVLQADVTRCGGITGFLAVAELCDARGVPLSAHTA